MAISVIRRRVLEMLVAGESPDWFRLARAYGWASASEERRIGRFLWRRGIHQHERSWRRREVHNDIRHLRELARLVDEGVVLAEVLISGYDEYEVEFRLPGLDRVRPNQEPVGFRLEDAMPPEDD